MGKSSKDKRDAYYRLAKEQGWRARSAFKLLQLDEEFDLFANVTRVVDLCAAPGSWSQVLSRVLIRGEKFGRTAWQDKQEKLRQEREMQNRPPMPKYFDSDGNEIIYPKPQEFPVVAENNPEEPELKPRKDVKIVAIDLQPMSPLEGIICLRADITHPATIPLLLKALDPTYVPSSDSQQASHPVDLVISDGAPDVTGLHDLDIYVQSQLLFAALNVALCVLKPGGKFVAKIFRGRNVDLLFAQLKIFFERVIVSKPRSSRASSVEAFVVCLNFQPSKGFKASLEEPIGVGERLSKIERWTRAQDPILAPLVSQNPNGTWSVGSKPTKTLGADGVVEIELGDEENKRRKQGRWIAPFLACGDLSAYDADATYHLPENRVTLDPVQPPTAPPYKKALEMRKAAGGAYGKTTI